MKKLLSANQAIAWAAYRGGCRVASAYPGTPSTEIMEHIAEFKGAINCEWSVNEKVAMEIAAGASLAGVRTLVAMKHVGLNVAMDPLMTFTYIGAIGGMVIVNADDPSLHSSQNEQDNRSLAKFAKCLLFEPSDSQEAYDMVLAGFELSEKYQVPVIIRTTTRTAHTSSIVDIGSGARGEAPAIPYVKNARRNVAVPANGRLMRFAVEKRSAQLRELTEASPFNRAEPGTGDIIQAVRHLRAMNAEIARIRSMRRDEIFEAAKELQVPYELLLSVHEDGRLPVVNFAAGGIATPADASLMMQLGAEGVFVGSGIFKSGDPKKRASAIVRAVTNYLDPKVLAEVSEDLGEAMVGINEKEITVLMAERGK